jgi:hypothetical protein
MPDKIESQQFDCPVLGGVALIQIRHEYIKVDEMPAPELHKSVFTNCRNKLECGIARPSGPRSYTFDWSLCPAHSTWNSKGRS